MLRETDGLRTESGLLAFNSASWDLLWSIMGV